MTTRIFLLTLLSFLSLKAQTIIKACAPVFFKPNIPCNGQCPSCGHLVSEIKYKSYATDRGYYFDSYRPALEFDQDYYEHIICPHCRNLFAATMQKV